MPQVNEFMRRISVKVIPKANANIIIPLGGNKYKVKVKAVAKKGQANQAVIKNLAKYFGVKKYQVEIISGEKSSYKQICVFDS